MLVLKEIIKLDIISTTLSQMKYKDLTYKPGCFEFQCVDFQCDHNKTIKKNSFRSYYIIISIHTYYIIQWASSMYQMINA